MNDENVLCLLRDVTGEKCPVANRNLARACFPALDSVAFSPQLSIGQLVSYLCRDWPDLITFVFGFTRVIRNFASAGRNLFCPKRKAHAHVKHL